MDGSGNVYVADSRNQRVQVFNSDGTFLFKWGSQGSEDGQFQFPVGITVDGSGRVYVAGAGNDQIQVFSGDGTFLFKWGSQGNDDGQFR